MHSRISLQDQYLASQASKVYKMYNGSRFPNLSNLYAHLLPFLSHLKSISRLSRIAKECNTNHMNVSMGKTVGMEFLNHWKENILGKRWTTLLLTLGIEASYSSPTDNAQRCAICESYLLENQHSFILIYNQSFLEKHVKIQHYVVVQEYLCYSCKYMSKLQV